MFIICHDSVSLVCTWKNWFYAKVSDAKKRGVNASWHKAGDAILCEKYILERLKETQRIHLPVRILKKQWSDKRDIITSNWLGKGFEKGEQVRVYFPLRKIDLSPIFSIGKVPMSATWKVDRLRLKQPAFTKRAREPTGIFNWRFGYECSWQQRGRYRITKQGR